MENKWTIAIETLDEIKVFSNPENEPVSISGDLGNLKCIGIGTDGAVFQHPTVPEYAFKVYAEDKIYKIEIEKNIYETIGKSFYFPTCFASYDKFIVLSYEKGNTLYDCLLKGIHIPEQAIKDVEEARDYVRNKGLNPRDIHLKNILLQDGRAKILDVSEYINPGNDSRWEHLRKAYKDYYYLIDRKPIPKWLLENIRKRYNQRKKLCYSYDSFARSILNLARLSKIK